MATAIDVKALRLEGFATAVRIDTLVHHQIAGRQSINQIGTGLIAGHCIYAVSYQHDGEDAVDQVIKKQKLQADKECFLLSVSVGREGGHIDPPEQAGRQYADSTKLD